MHVRAEKAASEGKVSEEFSDKGKGKKQALEIRDLYKQESTAETDIT